MVPSIWLITFLLIVGINAETQKGYCNVNLKVEDIPHGIVSQILHILTTGTIEYYLGCTPKNIPVTSIEYYLYNRNNSVDPIKLDPDNLSNIDPSKRTILLFHGWLCSHLDDMMPELKDAYLVRYDANIVVLDWSEWSIGLYTDSYCDVPSIADHVANFVCAFLPIGVDLTSLHFVGQGMGAQLAGLTAQRVTNRCGRMIARITALDPAGPLYQSIPTMRRLDEKDANSVDVIHTNMGVFGYFGPCGTTDFYVNCGTSQPGCFSLLNLTSSSSIINYQMSAINCNQMRSVEYMIESIVKPNPAFVGKRCDLCPNSPLLGICAANLFTKDTAIMGEDCPAKTPGSKYVLWTNSKPPYAKN